MRMRRFLETSTILIKIPELLDRLESRKGGFGWGVQRFGKIWDDLESSVDSENSFFLHLRFSSGRNKIANIAFAIDWKFSTDVSISRDACNLNKNSVFLPLVYTRILQSACNRSFSDYPFLFYFYNP